MNTKSVKEMLQNGSTAADLMDTLSKEITQAQAEIEKEKAAAAEEKKKAEVNEAKTDAARRKMIDGMVEWLSTLGVTDKKGIDKSEIEEMDNLLKALQPLMSTLVPLEIEEARDSDAIIRAFLRNL